MGAAAKLTVPGLALLAAGCLTLSGESDTRTIVSTPDGATVRIAGFGECETPCTVKLDGRREVTVAKAGYKAQRFAISPGGGDVNVVLELAAPTGAVESTTLPELE